MATFLIVYAKHDGQLQRIAIKLAEHLYAAGFDYTLLDIHGLHIETR
ncbi:MULTISPECIES: hypothetical protein [Deefgea]|uniref:Flavodoxin-like domain-containing protein n=1 Tax=Deefgea chitinilytica TaxID=570276 RepID=A0ABS2CBS7_9NEIS|nr:MULTISPECIES: hypothetical protein [Deefgea]MBM5571607.1 hypothetical protein [Deefgea chitinilytica]MBM9888842.1 hypothetical protein [Deefgea sp. CFH1-16]